MTSVGRAADPQTDAERKLVAWLSGGMLRPAPEDFAILRLILLASTTDGWDAAADRTPYKYDRQWGASEQKGTILDSSMMVSHCLV